MFSGAEKTFNYKGIPSRKTCTKLFKYDDVNVATGLKIIPGYTSVVVQLDESVRECTKSNFTLKAYSYSKWPEILYFNVTIFAENELKPEF